jgi:hypothetical protein
MKCDFCDGDIRKDELIVAFGNYYCPLCNQNLGSIYHPKENSRKTERKS